MIIPASVGQEAKALFKKNMTTLTHGTNNLFVFAADHKIQRLNESFSGPDITPEAQDPKHIFSIAQESSIGGLAVHLGLLERYAAEFKTIPYIAKLDGKTNLVPGDPYSKQIWTVEHAVTSAKNQNLSLCGIGYTVYVGSEYEKEMLTEAAKIAEKAHAKGLVVILWMYPRGQAVSNPHDAEIIAGAAGLGASLGADFVKITEPETGPADLQKIVAAAGNTRVLVAGGEKSNAQNYLEQVKKQMQYGVAGIATGRNIFQLNKHNAIHLANQLASIVYK